MIYGAQYNYTDEEVEYMIAMQQGNTAGWGLSSASDHAERVMEIMDEWFWMLENGTAQSKHPDMGDPISQQETEHIIKTIDDFILNEVTKYPGYFRRVGMYTKDKTIDLPADFNRLEGGARLAFAQAVRGVIKEG